MSALLALVALGAGTPTARAEGFSGAGSTLAYPMLQRWERSLAPRDGEGRPQVDTENGLDYEAVGSIAGVARLIQRAVDFAATDVPVHPEELDRQGLAQFPLVTGGIAVVVNLRGVAPGSLRLSGEALSRIYLGQITSWSDPAIKALNPTVTLPDAPITVVRRSDASGTSYHFAAYLAGSNAEWRDRIGTSSNPAWPVGTGARGNQPLAERVRATENAIGYVEASQAARLGLNVALIENRAGQYVAPGLANLQAAAATASWEPSRHFYSLQTDAAGADAYPIVATVFVLMPRRPNSTSRARRSLEFFRLALLEGASDARRLGYVPLPAALVQQVTAYWHANIQGAR